jgi:hypothetical protein
MWNFPIFIRISNKCKFVKSEINIFFILAIGIPFHLISTYPFSDLFVYTIPHQNWSKNSFNFIFFFRIILYPLLCHNNMGYFHFVLKSPNQPYFFIFYRNNFFHFQISIYFIHLIFNKSIYILYHYYFNIIKTSNHSFASILSFTNFQIFHDWYFLIQLKFYCLNKIMFIICHSSAVYFQIIGME